MEIGHVLPDVEPDVFQKSSYSTKKRIIFLLWFELPDTEAQTFTRKAEIARWVRTLFGPSRAATLPQQCPERAGCCRRRWRPGVFPPALGKTPTADIGLAREARWGRRSNGDGKRPQRVNEPGRGGRAGRAPRAMGGTSIFTGGSGSLRFAINEMSLPGQLLQSCLWTANNLSFLMFFFMRSELSVWIVMALHARHEHTVRSSLKDSFQNRAASQHKNPRERRKHQNERLD